MNSEYRPVVGYEGRYEVTAEGRVRSIPRMKVCGQGRIQQVRERLLSQQDLGRGYRHVHLCKGGVAKMLAVHRLVASAWLPPPQIEHAVVNHKNGLKHDNRAENLEWLSVAGNVAHSIQTGLKSSLGSANPNVKLSEQAVLEVRRRVGLGESRAALARELRVSAGCIEDIASRRRWAHL